MQRNLQKAASPNPNSSSGGALFTGSWPFAIPTLRAIRGTPYALFKTAGAIGSAGGWAIVMFLSCTVIWVVLLVRVANGETPMVAYLMVISAPLGISLLVMCVQWICKGALELGLAGCLISAGLLALAPSTALAMAVEFHHLLKVPGEAVEGIAKVRSIFGS